MFTGLGMMMEKKDSILCQQVDHILPKQQKLIFLKSTDKLPQALNVLMKNNIYSAPVWNETQKRFIGFVDLVDIVKFIAELFDHSSHFKKGAMRDEAGIFQIEAKKKRYENVSLENLEDISNSNPLQTIPHDATLLQALNEFHKTNAQRLFLSKSSTISHEDQITNILTQSAVVAFLHKNIDSLGSITESNVKSLGLPDKNMFFAEETDDVLKAFTLMSKHKVNSIPILTRQGGFLNMLSVKDVSFLQKSTFEELYKTCKDFLGERLKQPKFCSPETTIREIIIKMDTYKIHRIVVIEASKAIGLISLGDLLNILMEHHK